MRLNNRNKAGFYQFLMTFYLMLLVIGIAAFLLEKYRFDLFGWESSLFIIVPIILLINFYVMGRQIFEYDSDGETLNFKNRNIVLFLEKSLSDEFPKYKSIKYEIINTLFFKRLYVTISSKKNITTTLKYEISYLNRKQISDLKTSLNKVVKANKERDINS